MHVLVDGGYTNAAVLKHRPPNCVLIGRIRKDARLYWQPEPPAAGQRGRRALYGAPAPTPEQIRTTEAYPWETVRVFAAGAGHECRVKIVSPLLWRTAGAQLPLKLVVIAPLAYRPRPSSKLLYRQPAFLICTEHELDVRQLVQEYVWRCEIELNFHEEKSLLGVGEAQVRTPASTQSLPAFRIATFALFLLAGIQTAGQRGSALPAPKWSARAQPQRTSTQRLLHHLRAEVWGRGLGLSPNFSDFASQLGSVTKPEKLLPSLASALLYGNA